MGPNELGRLAAGALLLGLAIFLSLNLGKGNKSSAGADKDPLGEGVSVTSSPGSQPAWQAPERDELTAPPSADEIARPSFAPRNPVPGSLAGETRTRTAPQRESAAMASVPEVRDRYQPNAPAPNGAGHSLVPVEPKPGFGDPIRFTGTTHTIREGDTLQSIASEYYGSASRYLDIYLANRHLLSNPGRLPQGTEIRIPE